MRLVSGSVERTSTRHRTQAVVAFISSASFLSIGCGAAHAHLATPPEVAGSDDQQATCKVAKDPLNPLIVEWPGTSKVALDTASQRGVVVVSYAGCVLKVLPNCVAAGSYDFKGVTPVHDSLSIASEDELYARLPLGVASLKGELSTSGKLELDYVAVGTRIASPPASINGDCAGATHYVRSITVGAYGLDAVGKGKVAGSVGIDTRSVAGQHDESVRHLRSSGDVTRCAMEGAKSDGCMGVLQLGLAPLEASRGSAVPTPVARPALVEVPVVREFTTLIHAEHSDEFAVRLARLDNLIHDEFPLEGRHQTYSGTVPDIIGTADKAGHVTGGLYQSDVHLALGFDDDLERFVAPGVSADWVVAVVARQGTLFDELWMALYSADVRLFLPEQEELLGRFDASGVRQFQDQADDLRNNVKKGWRAKKEVELAGAAGNMVNRYATAVAFAGDRHVENRLVTSVQERLAYYTTILGEPTMRQYVTRTKEPSDLSGATFIAYVDGMYATLARSSNRVDRPPTQPGSAQRPAIHP